MADYIDGDYISDTHWLAMQRAMQGSAILSGMAVTPNGTQPPIEVDIAAGVYYANKTRTVYAGGSQALTVAHGTYDRWDIISGGVGGLTYTAGLAAAIPHPPDLPPNEILIIAIYVPANTTSITAAMIHEFGFFSELLEHATRHENGGADEMNVTGMSGVLADNQNFAVHGYAKHTDRTRWFGVGPGDFEGKSGDTPPVLTESTLGGTPQQYYPMPTGVDGDYLYCTIVIPQGWQTGVSVMNLIGCKISGTGNVLLNISCIKILKAGGTVPALATGWSPNAQAVPATIGETLVFNNSTQVGFAAGDVAIIKVRRNGTHIDDTFTGTWGFQGLRLEWLGDE